MLAQQTNTNLNFNNGAALRSTGLPDDDGFKQPFAFPDAGPFPTLGDGNFNAPPIVEAAGTTPLFHNNSAAAIEDAVQHYTTPEFNDQRDGGKLVGGISLTPDHTRTFWRSPTCLLCPFDSRRPAWRSARDGGDGPSGPPSTRSPRAAVE